MSPGESVVHDYSALSLSLKAHPVSFVRDELEQRRTLRCADLEQGPRRQPSSRSPVSFSSVSGPGTASGVIFATLEDETGIANIVIWNKVFDNNRKVVLDLAHARGTRQAADRWPRHPRDRPEPSPT